MSVEKCTQFRRARPDKNPNVEIQWCAKKGSDMNCGGFSDHCPKPMQKYFISDRAVPYEQITFKK
jgi:hypothetical protein